MAGVLGMTGVLSEPLAALAGKTHGVPPPPIVTTVAASAVTATTAQLNGTANPYTYETTGWFRFSTISPGTCNDSFGTRAPASGGTALGAGASPVPYSQPVSGLIAGTTYYFCAIAASWAGTSFGAVLSFNTAAPPCTEPPFPDVATDHPFCPEIKWMNTAGISTGFGDGTYRPDVAVTRQAMSAFMARLAAATLTPCTEPPFPDVPTDHPFCQEIKWMNAAGISTGFGDGTYRPTVAVTRQAMSAFMARLADATLSTCTQAPFTDVPTSHPFCSEIKWMKQTGISTGFGDGTYRPDVAVTRQAMSAFMWRVHFFVD